jgi:hypothetical protein
LALGARHRPDPAKHNDFTRSGGTGIRDGEAGRQDDLGHGKTGRHALRHLLEAFRTTSYRCDITFNDDGSWTYDIQTELLVKGRAQPFDHHDTNTLKLVEAPTLNPLALILNAGVNQNKA